MASDFVRVKDPGTGHEVTVTANFAKAFKLEPIEGKAALDDNGRPLPGKPHVELAKADNPTDDVAGSGAPEADPAASSTNTGTDAAKASATGTSGQTAGKAATR